MNWFGAEEPPPTKAYEAITTKLCGGDPFDDEKFNWADAWDVVGIAAALVSSLAEATNEDPLRILQHLEESANHEEEGQ